MDNFYEVLKDGVMLLKLINSLEPGRVKKINESKMAFKCMENISAFLEVAKAFGVPVQETFQTVDLWERQNLNSVVICLQSLGRKVNSLTLCLNFNLMNYFLLCRLKTLASHQLDQRKLKRMLETSQTSNLRQVKMSFHFNMVQIKVQLNQALILATHDTCKFLLLLL